MPLSDCAYEKFSFHKMAKGTLSHDKVCFTKKVMHGTELSKQTV